MANNIHPTAIIEDDVVLGDGNIIEAYSVIKSGTRLGNNNKVGVYTVLGETPTSPYYGGLYSNLVIGDNNAFYSHVSIQKGNGLNKSTIIGNNNMFYPHTTVAYNCTVGNDNLFVAYVGLASNIHVENNVSFLANSGAAIGDIQGLSSITIGSGAYIGAYSKVNASVSPFTCVMGGYNSAIYNSNNQMIAIRDYKTTDEEFETLMKIVTTTTGSSNIATKLSEQPKSTFRDYLLNFFYANRSIIKNYRGS